MSDATKPTIEAQSLPDGVYWRGARLWVSYYGPGEDGRMVQVREPAKRPDGTPARTPKEAARCREARQQEVAMHRRGVQAFQGPRAERLTVPELLDAVERHAKVHGHKSLPQLRSRLKRLRGYFASYRALAVTHDALMRYVQQRQAEDAAPATINRETEVVQRAFALAVASGKLSFAPKVPSLPERNARQGFSEAPEYEAIKAALPDDDLRDFSDFGYFTAWRKGEIASLGWADVDMAGGIIRLRPEHSKNGRGRMVALEADLKALIARRWQARVVTGPDGTTRVVNLVFHRRGEPVGDFRKAWVAACRKAGAPGRHFHDLRRTGVRNMVRAGVPERVAMEISGHKTRSVFDRYNIVSEEDARQAVARTAAYVASQPREATVVSLPTRAQVR